MAIHFHEEDLPRPTCLRRRADRGRYRGDGAHPGPRPAVPGPALRRQRRRASRPLRPRQRLCRAQSEGAARRSRAAQALSFRALRRRHHARLSRHHGRARSIAPAPPRGWCAPTPTATASRNWSRKCSARTSRSSSRPATGARPIINDAQRDYAASDVRYLHRLREQLDVRLVREGRTELAQACFDFLPARALLDLAGWAEMDIFAHG